ncbi:hypothetical protein JXI42_11695 [bacterium]|nr:hypothetical protein [bacterium]
MIFWILIFLGLTVLLLFSLYKGEGYTFESLLSAFLILLSALGVLYRSFVKIKIGRFESLQEKVKKLTEENAELKNKLGITNEKSKQDKKGIEGE